MTSSAHFSVVSPADDAVIYEGAFANTAELDALLARAVTAQRGWAATPLSERIQLVLRFLDTVEGIRDKAAEELSAQMGRPRTQTPGELSGFLDRGRTMARLAEEALADYLRLCDRGQPPERGAFLAAHADCAAGVAPLLDWLRLLTQQIAGA